MTDDQPVYYWDYLGLDQVLGAQVTTEAPGEDPGDELLFIITHQAFELWFAQILDELERVRDVLGTDPVPEDTLDRVVSRLVRITEIQRLLVTQIDVLETMTPLDFLEFRERLVPASGFQSVQFRIIENRWGLDRAHRLRVSGRPYTDVFRPDHVAAIEAAEDEPSVFDHVNAWLARTPFLALDGFDFWAAYRHAVESTLAAERQQIVAHPNLSDEARADQLARFDQTEEAFAALWDRDEWDRLVASGHRRLSHDAFLAALLISLYREEPILQLPHRLLRALVDVDQGFTTWRQRHALLAHRMIGSRTGTGGTAGHDYLAAAARKHRVFTDLFDLPTYLVPRSARPELPEEVRAQLGFSWSRR